MPKKIVLLSVILLLGLSLRLYGISFGLPFVYHADEPIVVNHAMACGAGDLNPHFFAIPPLASYLLFFLYCGYFIIGKLLNAFTSPDSFAVSFLRDPTPFYIIGRIFLGALPGVATILLIYNFGKKLFSERTGLLSALFASVVFIHVQNSHYSYVDILMVFFIVLTCMASLDIIRIGSVKNYIAAGVLAGIATAFKYNAAIVFIVVLTAHLINNEKRNVGRLAASFCALAITFVILNPYSLLDAGNFIKGIITQAGAEYKLGALYHLHYSLREGLGLGILVLGIIGMLYYAIKKPRTHLAFISFPVAFYMVLCFFSQPHERYVLALSPFLIIYSAAVISEKIKQGYLVLILIAVMIIPNVVKDVYSDYLFTQDDTRTMANKWIESNVQDGSKIAIEHSFFCPRLNQTKEQIKEKFSCIDAGEGAKDKRLRLALKIADEKRPSYFIFYLNDNFAINNGFLFERPQLSFSIPELKEKGVEYVVLHMDNPERMKKDFYRGLLKDAVLVKEFSPYKNKNKQLADDIIMQTGGPFLGRELFSRERNGYIIKIFKLNRIQGG